MVRLRLILTLCCGFISIAALQAQPLYVGEMSSGGLGMTDIGNKYVVKGIALDFYRRLGSYYGSLEKWVFEPKVAEKIFKDYIAEENIELWCNRRIVDARKEGDRIVNITLEDSMARATIRCRLITSASA